MTDRRMPAFRVEIQNEDLQKRGFDALVIGVEFQDADDKADVVSLSLSNWKDRLGDEIYFEEDLKLKLWMGYHNGLVYMGVFALGKPKFTYPTDGNRTLSFECKRDGTKQLVHSDERFQFKNMTDSQIAAEIARRYGLQSEVQDTEQIRETVTVAGANWMNFLRKRAKLYGYSVFLDEKSILHFHAPRDDDVTDSDGNLIELVYLEGGRGSLISFDAEENDEKQGVKVKNTQLDPRSKEITDHDGSPLPLDGGAAGKKKNAQQPDLNRTIYSGTKPKGQKGGVRGGKRKSRKKGRRRGPEELTKKKTSSISGLLTEAPTTPTRIIDGSSAQSKSRKETHMVADAHAQSGGWLIKATCTAIGLPFIRARKTIRLLGIGRLEGPFYIESTRHEIKGDRYALSFVARSYSTKRLKKGAGKSRGPEGKTSSDNVTDKSEVTNTVTIYNQGRTAIR